MAAETLIRTFGGDFFPETVLELHNSAQCKGIIAFEPMELIWGEKADRFRLHFLDTMYSDDLKKAASFLFLAESVFLNKQFWVLLTPHSTVTSSNFLCKLWPCLFDTAQYSTQELAYLFSQEKGIPVHCYLVAENMAPLVRPCLNAC